MRPKLLLFDIDGTLITGHGVPKQAAMEVMHRHYPGYKPQQRFHFAGLTDPEIFREILQIYGVADPAPEKVNGLIREFIDVLKTRVTLDNPPHLLPGAKELVERCANRPDCFLALVTGNVLAGAHIKLKASGLHRYFVTGAFGDDNYDRNCLPPIAVRRAEKYFQREFKKQNTWIIGDSAKDVECAIKSDLHCLAVETGLASRDELRQAGAKHLVKDLSDTENIMAMF